MQQHIALVDDLEDAHVVAQGARIERRVLELWPLHQVVDLGHAAQVHWTGNAVHRVFVEAEILQQGAHDRRRAIVRNLQPHRRPVAARDQFVAQRQRQVFHFFFVYHQLGIAGDAELVGALDLHAREQFVHELREHRGQEHEALLAVRRQAGGQLDDARQRARGAHDRQMAGAPERVLAIEHHHDVQGLVEDLRERMCRVQAQRRQHRHDLVAEVGAQPAFLARIPGGAAQHRHPGLFHRRAQHVVPHVVLLIHQLGGAVVHRVEDGGGAHAIGCGRQAELLRMPHGGCADLEELVQVGAGNAQEA